MALTSALIAPFDYLVGFPVGQATIHPLHLWGAAALCLTLLTSPRSLLDGCDIPTLLLLTMLAFLASSTVFGTPSEYRLRGLLDMILLAINLLVFTLTYSQVSRAFLNWLSFSTMLFSASLIASALLVARAVWVAKSGEFVSPDSYILGLGTVTGTFSAAFAAASLAGMVFSTDRRMRLLFGLGVVLHGLATGLALARGPWLAFGIAVAATLVVMWWARRREVSLFGLAQRLALPLLLLPLGVLAAANNRTVAQLLASRFLQLWNLTTGTGLARISLFRALLDDATNSPFFGHGAASYRRVSELLGVQGSVSENFLLEIFHAGGAAAALPLLIAMIVVVVRLKHASQSSADPGMVAATLSGVLAMTLGALTNPAAWSTCFWILFALGAALGPASADHNRSLPMTPGAATAPHFK